MKIKKNDLVKMLSGKDKGKTGKVLRVFGAERKVQVEKLNTVKKHSRPKKEGQKGQRIEMPRRVDVSKVVLVCPKCSKPSRVGYKVSAGKKLRFCKKCQAEL